MDKIDSSIGEPSKEIETGIEDIAKDEFDVNAKINEEVYDIIKKNNAYAKLRPTMIDDNDSINDFQSESIGSHQGETVNLISILNKNSYGGAISNIKKEIAELEAPPKVLSLDEMEEKKETDEEK